MKIETVAVLGYLAVTLFVGWWFVRKQPNTLEEYALAGRGLSTLALTVSFIATFIGSGDIESLNRPYQIGFEHLLTYPCGMLFGLFLLAKWVYPYCVGRGYFTLGDAIEPLYGKLARISIGVLGVVYCVGYITSELSMLGRFAFIAGLSPAWLITLCGTALVLYTATGGVRSVTVTDFLQFVFIVAGMVYISELVVLKVGSFKQIFHNTWLNHYTHIALGARTKPWLGERLCRTIFWSWPVTFLSPPFFQRVAMASSQRQLGRMIKFFTAFYLAFIILCLTLSLGSLAIPEVRTAFASQDMLFLAIVKSVAQSRFSQLLVLFFVLSVMLSVADSFLNAGSIVLVRDVLKPLISRPIDEIRWSKSVSVVLGIGAVGFSVIVGKMSANLQEAAVKVLLSIGVVPLAAGLLGLKTTPKMFWHCCGTFLLTCALVLLAKWSYLMTLGATIDRVRYVWLAALPISIVGFFISHLWQFKCFAKGSSKRGIKEILLDGSAWSWEQLKGVGNLVELARNRAKRYGKEEVLFPLFISIVYMLPSITATQYSQSKLAAEAVVRLIGVSLCALLLARPFWSASAMRGFSLFYFITLGYCLPFVATFRFFGDPSDPLAMIYWAFSALLLSVLVDAELFVGLLTVGSMGTMATWKLTYGSWIPSLTFDQGWTLLWTLLASSGVGFFFGRRRQKRYEMLQLGLQQASLREQGLNQDWLHALGHTKQFTMNLEQQCLASLEESSRLLKTRKLSQQELEELGEKTERAVTHLRQLERHLAGHITLDLKTHSIEEMAREILQSAFVEPERLKIELDTTAGSVRWDLPKMKEVVLQAIGIANEEAPEEDSILLRFEDTSLRYVEGPLTLKEKVAALRILVSSRPELALLQRTYTIEVSSWPSEQEANLSSSRTKRILQAHRGTIETAEGGFAIILPVEASKVRPKKLDKAAPTDEQIQTATTRLLPEETTLRKALEAAHLLTPQIEEAIAIMKRYHANQDRKLEGPYAIHPLTAAYIVLTYLLHRPQQPTAQRVTIEQAVIASLLHDVVEDTRADFTLLGSIFGPNVQEMVERVSKLTTTAVALKLENEEASGGFIATQDALGYHAALIKLADRVHNMRTIAGHEEPKRKKIAKETAEVYIPLAQKIGAIEIAKELQAMCDEVLGRQAKKL